MSKRRAAGVGALLLGALAACGSSSDQSVSPPVSTISSAASPSPTPSPSPPTPTLPDGSVRVGPISLVPPAGWQVIRDIAYPGNGPFDLCLAPKGATAYVSGCAGVLVYWGSDIPGGEQSAYAPNQADGWYHASDVQPCPVGKASTDDDINGIDPGGGPTEDGLQPVGMHQADYDRWTATCQDGSTFTPEAWYLPKTRVLIQDFLSNPETAAILSSVRLETDGVPLPAAPTTYGATLQGFDGAAMTVQPIHTYDNDAEGEAYAKANGISYPFDDDHYDAEDGARKPLPIVASTVCVGNVTVSGTQYPAPVVDCAKFEDVPQIVLQVWAAADGTAEQVSEQFRP